MIHRILFLLAIFSLSAYSQAWSTFLNPSRAIDWTSTGFAIPNYTTNCAKQPTLTANNPSAAAANTTAIQNALASCDAAHNVVSIPAGTYYVAGWTYGSQGNQLIRGAGPKSTYLYMTATASCAGLNHAVCMIDGNTQSAGAASVLPPKGTQQCLWTGGYAKGTTTVTLNSCPGGAPPVNQTLILDQADDVYSADTGGVMICGDVQPGCTNESGDEHGRQINGITHSQQQIVMVTGVSGSGTGPYTVTISPGIYVNNIRSSQAPGTWWPGFVQNDGLENLTVDYSTVVGSVTPWGTISMINCYHCWVRNVRSLYAERNHVLLLQSAQDVIRDNYFYGATGGGASQSYGIEYEIASGVLLENNIFQQITAPIMFGTGTGCVIAYNFSIGDIYTAASTFAMASFYGHSPGGEMNLWEGNNLLGIWTDPVHGTTATGTYFRNMLVGWQAGKSNATFPIILRARHRAFNSVGNVLGQPGYHDTYESYATSSTGGVNASGANTSIYELGWSDIGGFGVCTTVTCDALVRPTLMRWGNWDVVTNGTKWDSMEASPGAVAYVNANFTSSYFSSLAHTLPASLYYSSKPSWWPAAKAWPPVGPDVSSGNLGICSGGTYAGVQTMASSQCSGGTLKAAYASHATSIPAQDCYLNVMGGLPDGTGNVLNFDAGLCYASSQTSPVPPTKVVPPTNVVTTVR